MSRQFPPKFPFVCPWQNRGACSREPAASAQTAGDPQIFMAVSPKSPASPSVRLSTPYVTTTLKLCKIVKKIAKKHKIARKSTKKSKLNTKNPKIVEHYISIYAYTYILSPNPPASVADYPKEPLKNNHPISGAAHTTHP